MDFYMKVVFSVIALALSLIAWEMTGPANPAIAQASRDGQQPVGVCGATIDKPCIVAVMNQCGIRPSDPCLVTTVEGLPVQVVTSEDQPLSIFGVVRVQ